MLAGRRRVLVALTTVIRHGSALPLVLYCYVVLLRSKDLPSRRVSDVRLVGPIGISPCEPSVQALLLGYPPTSDVWCC